MRILSVDIGIRHMAWFTGTLCLGEPSQCSVPMQHVASVAAAYQWELVDIVPPEAGVDNVNTLRVEDLVPWLVRSFEAIKERMLFTDNHAVEHVFLEQQPLGTGEAAARNIKTKVLSHLLQACILRELPGVAITFVSPRKKLRHAQVALGRAPETYADNKRAAKLLTPLVLRQLGAAAAALDFERRKGKKDDLADALLQGLYAAEDWAEEERKRIKRVQKSQEPVREKKPPAKRAKKAQVDALTAAASASLLGPLPPSASSSSSASASEQASDAPPSSTTSSSSSSASSASVSCTSAPSGAGTLLSEPSKEVE